MNRLQKNFQITCVFLLLFISANAQKVDGKVTDTNGNPIESVSIIVKSTNAGTTTNSNGEFSISAKTGDILTFTSTGYKIQQFAIRNMSFISVTMIPEITQLEQIVLLGSRGGGRVKLESPVPVDVINLGDANLSSGRSGLTSLLNYAAPSFNFNKQSGSDGADQIDLATLRGLGPDQTLVLVNGKRRHQTAFVAIFGTRGRGNSGTDLNALPEAAIDRVEILRDGASAQYGSDAIAGVMNLVLKKQTPDWQIDLGGSGYYDKKFNPYFKKSLHSQYVFGDGLDGKAFNVSINKGFPIGKAKTGFIHITGDYFTQEKTFRQVLNNDLSTKDGLPINTGRRAVGDASVNSGGGFVNMEIPVSFTKTIFYAFGGYNTKSSDAFAYTRSFHHYSDPGAARPERFPTDADGKLIYDPNYMIPVPIPGNNPDTIFNPHIQTKISDGSISAGFKGTMAHDWSWDVSNTIGKNDFHYYGDKTYNASLGAAGIHQNHFDDGGFSFLQNTTNVDFSKNVPSVAQGLVFSAGGEFRFEQYKIYAGEKASYFNYDIANGKASGSQGFPGFQPADEVNAKRYTEGLYVQADLDVTNKWLTTGAIRAENYSDFGFLSTYKFATRYKVSPKVNIRGSVSTGFRAPSLQQINFSNTFTNFQGGISFDVKLAPNYSDITKAAGIPKLTQEKSVNASLGFTAKPFENFTVTVDGYLVKIKNRVVLSGQFDNTTALKPILDELNISQLQFFANAVNTTNTGIDIILNYSKDWNYQSLNVLLASNFQNMKIDKINVPSKLNGSFEERQAFFSEREQKFVLASAPPQKIGLTVDYGVSQNFKVGTHVTYFGKIILYGYGWDNTYPPLIELDNGKTVTEQFNYNGKLVTDLYLSYKINKHLTLYTGADNLFNIHPDLGFVPGANTKAYDGETGGAWDPVQMGINGMRLFLKAKINL